MREEGERMREEGKRRRVEKSGHEFEQYLFRRFFLSLFLFFSFGWKILLPSPSETLYIERERERGRERKRLLFPKEKIGVKEKKIVVSRDSSNADPQPNKKDEELE